ncbi:MAG: NAD(P)-dependent oxidoreductase [Spirochaetia bacterium]
MTEKKIIGWIGTGVMGLPMCRHLIQAGYAVKVHNRTKKKTEALVSMGAQYAGDPAEAAENADVVFTIVGFPHDVREVYLGERGILSTVSTGTICVDMTTTEPSLEIEIAEQLGGKGASLVDAPVSGGDVGAEKGTLSIMAGGNEEDFQRVLPLLEVLGSKIVYQGPVGNGQHTKMCNQTVIAGTMIGMCEALLYGRRAGLSAETMLESISGGAAGCWSLDNLAPRIINNDYSPGFFIDHFVKDMGIALKEASAMNLALPGLALVHQLYTALQSQGKGKLGTQALIQALDSLNGLQTERKNS